ncbi:MAG: GNAT family N-acetyltransferase [Candidatus Dormibacteraeota bacterium]|nr:GNAT family N-acetyltransferase [Candidatus Dormibacteraeota bacterium]
MSGCEDTTRDAFVIRPFHSDDSSAVRALHELALRDADAFVEGPTGSRWDSDLDDIAASYLANGGVFLVDEVHCQVGAMGALLILDDSRGKIKRMRVHPTYQRRGYGRSILAALEHAPLNVT